MDDRPGFPRSGVACNGPSRVEVRVTRFDYGLEDADVAALPDADLSRAAAISCTTRRAEYLAAHRLLHDLLAWRVDCLLVAQSIVQEAGGKPRLARGKIEFSLSHRGNWCAVALSADCPVGVDLEPIRTFAGMNELAAEFFPPQARAAYEAAPLGERASVFFRWWTCIEAAVKATGCGLDKSVSSLNGVSYQSCDEVKGLALAVAARSNGHLIVNWRLPEMRSQRAPETSIPGIARL